MFDVATIGRPARGSIADLRDRLDEWRMELTARGPSMERIKDLAVLPGRRDRPDRRPLLLAIAIVVALVAVATIVIGSTVRSVMQVSPAVPNADRSTNGPRRRTNVGRRGEWSVTDESPSVGSMGALDGDERGEGWDERGEGWDRSAAGETPMGSIPAR